MFSKYREFRAPQQDAVTDFFGAVTPITCAPYLASRAGSVIEEPPFPSDSLRANFIEYIAVIESINSASLKSYQMVELGASYAPFAVLSAILAARRGVESITVCAVEAARNGVDAIRKNFGANGFDEDSIVVVNSFPESPAGLSAQVRVAAPGVSIIAIEGAYSSKCQTLWFPDVDCTIDNGAKTSGEDLELDCRGRAYQNVPVNAFTIDQILSVFRPDSPVDLAHIDIQGEELTVLPDSIALLNQRVKRVMLGTHSRLIEGLMLDLFHRNGWLLIAEEPCGFIYNSALNDFIGMTNKDGSQYWLNTRFS